MQSRIWPIHSALSSTQKVRSHQIFSNTRLADLAVEFRLALFFWYRQSLSRWSRMSWVKQISAIIYFCFLLIFQCVSGHCSVKLFTVPYFSVRSQKSIVEADRPPSWSLDACETEESTKYPWVGVVEGTAGEKLSLFFVFSWFVRGFKRQGIEFSLNESFYACKTCKTKVLSLCWVEFYFATFYVALNQIKGSNLRAKINLKLFQKNQTQIIWNITT